MGKLWETNGRFPSFDLAHSERIRWPAPVLGVPEPKIPPTVDLWYWDSHSGSVYNLRRGTKATLLQPGYLVVKERFLRRSL